MVRKGINSVAPIEASSPTPKASERREPEAEHSRYPYSVVEYRLGLAWCDCNPEQETMHRLPLLSVVCAALMSGAAAIAQVPPDPNNPNETVPEAMTQPQYGEPINIETAKKVAAGAIAEAKKRNWNGMCVAIVDPSGELVYFEKQDNCQYASITISQHKARVAARYRRPTLVFERLLGKGNFYAYLTTLDDIVASRGGNPLVVDGKVIGAIGVSGGAGSQDDTVSQAGVAALK
jgi:uncharacterized protein GlcG (DUF336 family)